MPGILTVDSSSLSFECDSGRAGIPLERIQLDRDDDRHLRITDRLDPNLCFVVAQDSLLNDYFLRHNNAARAEIRRFRQAQESSRTLRLSLVFLAVCAGLAVVFSLGSRIASAFVVARVSPAYEIELGEEVLDQLELTFEDAPGEVAWLETLLGRVTASLPRETRDRSRWRILIAVHPMPNAASLPGGTVIVTSGLLTQLTEPDEIAAVLAHEVAHIQHRHGLRSLIRIVGPYYALQAFTLDRQAFVRSAGGAALLVSQQFYSREQEFEADETAWNLLRDASLDPRSLSRGLERLRDPETRGGVPVAPPRFLLSHPPDHERIARLEEMWSRAQSSGPFEPLPPRRSP